MPTKSQRCRYVRGLEALGGTWPLLEQLSPLMLSLVCSFETADLVEEILVQLKGVRVASSLGARIVQGEIRVVGSILSATDMNTLDHQFSVLRPDQDW